MSRLHLILAVAVLGASAGCSRPEHPLARVEKPSWFKGSKPGQKVSPDQIKEQIEAANAKIGKIEATRASNRKLLDKFLKDKEAVITRLKEVGVKSSFDVKTSPKAKRYTDELLRVVKDMEPLERLDEKCEEAIGKLKSLVRRLEISLVVEDSGMTDQELTVLSSEIMKLDEKQGVAAGSDAVDPLKLDALLKKELNPK